MKYEFKCTLRYRYWISLAERARDSDPTISRSCGSACFPAGKYHNSIWQLCCRVIVREAEIIDGIER